MALQSVLFNDVLALISSLMVKENVILLVKVVFAISFLYLLGKSIYNRYFHPLKDIPGPFWASMTPLWLWQSVHLAKGDNFLLPIHKNYGSMVRLAPNHIEIADPEAIEAIYGPKADFPKSPFYNSFESHLSTTPDSFCCLDSKTHDRRRRAVAPFYTQAAILEYEPAVDRIINQFCQRMDELVDSGETTDMAMWMRKYTFDVIGELFYGREEGFGFLRDNIDYNNWGVLLDVLIRPMSASGYAPAGFRTLNLIFQFFSPMARRGMFGFFEVVKQARQTLKTRLDEMAMNRGGTGRDILGKLIKVAQSPDQKHGFGLPDVQSEIFSVIFAGADTTATALGAIFYFSHRDPRVLAKLKKEIDEAFESGKLKYPVRFADANKLSYLRAVVNEAFRVHPSTGLALPRIVPKGGAVICGKYFPAGTEVAMNAAVSQFDRKLYGDDAEEYIPERWIRDGQQQAAKMERHSLQFGYGKRICLGKHISYVEMFKLIPTILHKFNFERVGNKEWTVAYEWLMHVKNVHVKVSRRNPGSNAKVE